MRVIVFVKATPESEAGEMPSSELLEAMGHYNQQLIEAGIMQTGEGLHPTSRAKRVTFDGLQRIVTDGPFTETKEIVSGYWVWEVRDMDEAVEWVKKCPNPMHGRSDIDIRPVFTAEDFGEALTDTARELHYGKD